MRAAALLGLLLLQAWGHACAAAAGETVVIYFGGWRSSPAQMDAWRRAAEGAELARKVTFVAIAYPEGASDDGRAAAQRMLPQLRHAASRIVSNASDRYIVACHSSGCGLANVLVEQVLDIRSGVHNLELINLDGGASGGSLPTGRIFAALPVTCWASRSATSNALFSLYYADAQRFCPRHTFRELRLSGCNNPMCLHFQLINLAAPQIGARSNSEYIQRGYTSMRINLGWLTPSLQ